MPIDPVLASVHYRVGMAGSAAEIAASALRNRQAARGMVALQQVVSSLEKAALAVKASGNYPTLLAALNGLIAHYEGLRKQVQPLRPLQAPSIGDKVFAAQGLLLVTDPFVNGMISATA